MRDPRLVPPQLLNAAREMQANVLTHAKDELQRLFSTLCHARYATLMADRHGIVTWRYALPADATDLDCRGLRLGSDWRENLEGTNGIGTCLVTEHSLSVHQTEHFKARHASFSSSAAIVRAPTGEIAAVIGAVACNQKEASGAHVLALAAITATARAIEERMFRAAHPECWILLLSDERYASQQAFLALDCGLRIVGADFCAHRSLCRPTASVAIGTSLNALFAGAEHCQTAQDLAAKTPSLRRRQDGASWNGVITAPAARAWPRSSVDSQSFRLYCGSLGGVVLSEMKEATKGGLSTRASQRVREYISSHLPYDMPLEDLAAIAEVSMSHFSREFKRSFGVSPHQYIVVKRVERAAQLITTTRHLFSDIALEVGFSDQSHFSRSFRQVLNLTPREFRRTLPSVKAPRRTDIGLAQRRSQATEATIR
jgi:AraC-like DNA-binding protein